MAFGAADLRKPRSSSKNSGTAGKHGTRGRLRSGTAQREEKSHRAVSEQQIVSRARHSLSDERSEAVGGYSRGANRMRSGAAGTALNLLWMCGFSQVMRTGENKPVVKLKRIL